MRCGKLQTGFHECLSFFIINAVYISFPCISVSWIVFFTCITSNLNPGRNARYKVWKRSREVNTCAINFDAVPPGASGGDDVPDPHPLQGRVGRGVGRARDRLHPVPAEGRGAAARPQRGEKPPLRLQRGAEGAAGEGGERSSADHAVVQPHRQHLPVHVVGQPTKPQTVHRSRAHPPYVISTAPSESEIHSIIQTDLL